VWCGVYRCIAALASYNDSGAADAGRRLTTTHDRILASGQVAPPASCAMPWALAAPPRARAILAAPTPSPDRSRRRSSAAHHWQAAQTRHGENTNHVAGGLRVAA